MRSINIVLYILLGVFLGCEAGGGGNGDSPDPCAGPKADRPKFCEALETDSAINEPDANETQGFCGDGVCGASENCSTCELDCPCADDLVCNNVGVCVQDPLADYYWIEGTWKCEPTKDWDCGYITTVEVEIIGWDDKKGANVDGFSPCIGYLLKDGDEIYLFSGTSQDGSIQCKEGTLDKNKNELTFFSVGVDNISYAQKYIKL